MAMQVQQQMASDEELARRMQQEDLQQHSWMWGTAGGGVPVTQMGQPPGSGGGVPVVQGRVVGGAPVGGTGGAPMVIGAPTGGVVGMTYAAVIEAIPMNEAIVLRYRFPLMCFAFIDALSTIFNAASSAGLFGAFGKMSENEDKSGVGDETSAAEREALGPRSLGIFGLVFLIGPIAGVVGAKRLHRGFTSLYLAFCVAKTAYEIFLVAMAPGIWYILIALVQMWVTKLVFTFWRALGRTSPERCAELLDPIAVL
mmetsp:Transcript_23523/g.79748  ORF Transcript_23523/g.79748 Transcript_23523/m.79748 type:complete len:255 (+) Transcript_23523:110-874(+)